MYYSVFETSICLMTIAGDEKGVCNLYFNTGKGKRSFEILEEWAVNDDFHKESIMQIKDYLDGKRKRFDIEINPRGTEYQKKVWAELLDIPYANLCSYKDIAIKTGNGKASRAVGMAIGKNPIPLIIPCHRVVGKNGKLTGFAHGVEMKRQLIELEQNNL